MGSTAPPGTPNTYSTPALSRQATIHSTASMATGVARSAGVARGLGLAMTRREESVPVRTAVMWSGELRASEAGNCAVHNSHLRIHGFGSSPARRRRGLQMIEAVLADAPKIGSTKMSATG